MTSGHSYWKTMIARTTMRSKCHIEAALLPRIISDMHCYSKGTRKRRSNKNIAHRETKVMRYVTRAQVPMETEASRTRFYFMYVFLRTYFILVEGCRRSRGFCPIESSV